MLFNIASVLYNNYFCNLTTELVYNVFNNFGLADEVYVSLWTYIKDTGLIKFVRFSVSFISQICSLMLNEKVDLSKCERSNKSEQTVKEFAIDLLVKCVGKNSELG